MCEEQEVLMASMDEVQARLSNTVNYEHYLTIMIL